MSELPLLIREALQLDVIQRCQALQDRAEAALNSEFAASSPEQYLRLIARIGGAIKKDLTLGPRTTHELAIVDSFVREISAHIRYAEGATSSRIPWSLSRPIESLAQRFLGGITILLRPQWTHNYSIIISDIGEVYKKQVRALLRNGESEIQEIFEGFPQPFHIVSLPALERMNLLLHCDLAHEVGHLVAERFLGNPALDRDSFSVFFQAKISRRVRTQAASRGKSLSPAQEAMAVQHLLQRAIVIRRRALEELISDLFAASAFGPASLLALAAMVLPQPLDELPTEGSGFYPPSGFRLHLVFDHLEKRGLAPPKLPGKPSKYVATFEAEVANYFLQLRDLVSRFPLLSGENHRSLKFFKDDWLTRLAYFSVAKTLPRVHEFLESTCLGLVPTTRELLEPLGELLERLAAGLPPNEHRQPSGSHVAARLECMLNAAWYFRLGALRSHQTNGDATNSRIPDLPTVNRLTLRAIELARVHSDYKDWKEGEHEPAH